MNQAQRRLFLIQSLLKERVEYRDMDIPAELERQRQLLRSLMNIRAPQSANADFLKIQDAYLQGETAAKGVTDVAELTPIQPGLYHFCLSSRDVQLTFVPIHAPRWGDSLRAA